MATYIKTLKEDNGDITYPQTSSDAVLMPTGETLETRISNYVTAENIAETAPITPTITHEMIQEGAVKSDNIDWTTLTPYWKVVSVVNGTNAWTIPAGYRYYRLVMRYASTAPSSASRGAIQNSANTGTNWSSYVGQQSGTVAGGESSWTTATICLLHTVANTTAASWVVSMELMRVSSQSFMGNYSTGTSGFNAFMSGKVEFSVSTAGDFYLSAYRANSTLSGFSGYVEALVES